MVSLYDQEAANRKNSIFLVVIVMLVFAVLGYVIGYAVTGDAGGAIRAIAIAIGTHPRLAESGRARPDDFVDSGGPPEREAGR